MAKKNKLKEKIALYKMFIKEKKIGPGSVPFYTREMKNAEMYLKLLKEGKMTPGKFNKISDRDKWDIYHSNLLKNVMWCCGNCMAKIGNKLPDSPFFSGETVDCTNCDAMLTRRTNGGQNNPFNYTFKKLKIK